MGHLREHSFLAISSKMLFNLFETLPAEGSVVADQ